MSAPIPRRIIQTSKSLDLTLLEQAAVANVRLLNPDFEYMFFDNQQVEDFFSHEYPQYRHVFESFAVPIEKYDFFRYLAIYRFGGFYLDMDVLLASGLSPLTAHECVFPFERLTFNDWLRREHGMDWDVGNYAFGAVAGHPFLKAVIDNCVRAQRDSTWANDMGRWIPAMFREELGVLYTTGPWLVSRTLAEFADAPERVKILFPNDVCNEESWNRFGSVGVHLMAGSWRRHGHMRRRLQNYWEVWKTNANLREGRKLGKSRSLEVHLQDNGSNARLADTTVGP